MDDPEYFECSCHSPEHTLRFWFDDDEDYPFVYASVFLGSVPWRRRVWLGIRYIFGYKCRYGHFDEFLLRPEDADRLIAVAEALKKAKKA
jgi:hypothetical protein